MALGLERAIAEFLRDVVAIQPSVTTDPWPLYDEPSPVVYIGEEPVGREDEDDTARDLSITVFTDGGEPPQLLLGEVWTITIHGVGALRGCRDHGDTRLGIATDLHEATQDSRVSPPALPATDGNHVAAGRAVGCGSRVQEFAS